MNQSDSVQTDAASRKAAKEIEQQHPGWMVIWGVYSKQYVAFPLFRAPRGTILTAGYPPALMERMQTVEQRAPKTRRPAGHQQR